MILLSLTTHGLPSARSDWLNGLTLTDTEMDSMVAASQHSLLTRRLSEHKNARGRGIWHRAVSRASPSL